MRSFYGGLNQKPSRARTIFWGHPKRRRRRGVAAVEMAICLPMFLTVALGIIICCDVIFTRQMLVLAAHEGARVAITPRAAEINVRAHVDTVLADRGVGNYQVTVSPPIAQVAPGQLITVRIQAVSGEGSADFFQLRRRFQVAAQCTMMME
jgi:hypothetical protein